MKARMLALAVAAAAGTASAQTLFIDVVGNPGSGVTTWTFSGSSTTSAAFVAPATIRTNVANSFNAGDSGQFPFGLDTILDTSIQDVVFTLTGNASVTVGNQTRTITGIYLDDDGGSADDMGIRVDTDLVYGNSEPSSWTGSGTANIDINTFDLNGSPWSLNGFDGQAIFLSPETVVTFRIPTPGSVAVLGIAGLATLRRRR